MQAATVSYQDISVYNVTFRTYDAERYWHEFKGTDEDDDVNTDEAERQVLPQSLSHHTSFMYYNTMFIFGGNISFRLCITSAYAYIVVVFR